MKNKILVIEDDRAISELLCMNLEAAGYETVAAYDGEEAQRLLLWQEDADMAVVDIMPVSYTHLDVYKRQGHTLEQHDLQDANGNTVTVTETTNGDYYFQDENGTGFTDNGDGTWSDENGNSYTEID